MQWFDDLVLEVTGQDEATVITELLDEPTQGRLSRLGIQVVCLIEDDNLVTARQGDTGGKLLDLTTEGVDVAIL